jgi:hypothetical protein
MQNVTVSVTCDRMLNPTVGPLGVVTIQFVVLGPALLSAGWGTVPQFRQLHTTVVTFASQFPPHSPPILTL